MTKDIKNYIKNCDVCEKSKINRHTKNPMIITDTASEPFQKVYMDLVGPINPVSFDGNTYIFTCNCSLTKFAIAVPIQDASAITTAKAFVHNVILKYGAVEEIVSDNGTNFISDTLREVNKILKIKKVFTTPYHPQSNQVERFHKTLANYLKAFIQHEQDKWSEYLDFAVFAYNNSHNSATGFSPFQLVFGRNAKLPSEILNKKFPVYNYDNYAHELRSKLKECHDLAKENILKMKMNNKKHYDKHRDEKVLDLKINDLVLVLKPKKIFKFENPYEGPYRVEELISPVAIKIRKGNKTIRVHTDRVKKATANYGNKTPPKIHKTTNIADNT